MKEIALHNPKFGSTNFKFDVTGLSAYCDNGYCDSIKSDNVTIAFCVTFTWSKQRQIKREALYKFWI